MVQRHQENPEKCEVQEGNVPVFFLTDKSLILPRVHKSHEKKEKDLSSQWSPATTSTGRKSVLKAF